MKEHEKSRVWLFGDNVNTDLMSPGYTWNMEWSEAKKHILVNHPRFAPEVREGDIIVAGDNFGCGSSRRGSSAESAETGDQGRGCKVFLPGSSFETALRWGFQ